MARPPAARRPFRKASSRARPANLWGKDTLTIERMSQEGRGVAHREGKIVFVSGALEGEQVRAQCTAVKKDFDEADMIERVAGTAPSPHRTQPECLIYEDCGGCSLQHWSITAQKQHKHASLQAMLQTVAPVTLETAVSGPSSGFRHRLRLLVTRGTDRSYSLALRERHSHRAVHVQHCVVANAAVNTMLQALPDKLLLVPDLQGLREIDIDADSNNQLGLCFYFAAHPGEKSLSALRNTMLTAPVVALRVRLNTQKLLRRDARGAQPNVAGQAQWQELLAEGELCLRSQTDTGDGAPLRPALALGYQPGDFTQTHWAINAALVERALDWLQPGAAEHALDLFAGIGNFSLPLAQLAHTVHAFESDSSMTLRVTANARRNGIANLCATTANLMADGLVLARADIAIVDPPRAGAKAVCEALIRAKVKRVLYVSCHPATLVRDAGILHRAGYRLSRAAAVDMFPHTGHSEAITLFQRP